MPHSLAAVLFAVLIAGLFWLDRPRSRTSWALWVPVVWLWIVCSRPVSAWIGRGSVAVSAEQVSDGSPADRAFFAALLIVGLGILMTRGDRVAKLLSGNAAILIFFLYCTLSLLWSEFPAVAFKRWTKAIGDLVMILIVLSEDEPLAAIERLLARLGFTLIPLSVLFTKYFPQYGMTYNEWVGTPIYLGVTLNKNNLGAICMIFGMGALWRIATELRNRPQAQWRIIAAQGIVLLMILRLFYLLDSKTSLSSFLMAATILLVTNLRFVTRMSALVHVMVVSLASISASIVFLGVSPDLLKAIGRNPTLTERTLLWNQLLKFVTNPLLGTGFESFWLGPRLDKIWEMNPWAPNQAHNGYIEIYLNLGWVGVALLAVVIVTGYWKVFTSWKSGAPTASLSLAFFFTAIVFNFTEAAFFRMQATVSVFFLLAVMNATKAPGSQRVRRLTISEQWFGQRQPEYVGEQV